MTDKTAYTVSVIRPGAFPFPYAWEIRAGGGPVRRSRDTFRSARAALAAGLKALQALEEDGR